MNWMNLPDEYCTKASKCVILPVLYEKDLTYGDGASLGPLEIIKASKHLEYYDEQRDSEAFIEGIRLLEPLDLNDTSPEDMVKIVSQSVAKNVDTNKFLIGLGGDHAITNGVVAGLEKVYGENFSIIQFDAHSDFRDTWNGSSLNHACVARQLSTKHDIALVGVRSQDIDEARMIKEADNVHLIKSYDYTQEKLKGILPKLKENVFITIDVDVFDPSFIRNTGTPEPGGFMWDQIVDALALIFREKRVIGCDIVEFAPKVNFEAEAYALAKLVYKLCNLYNT